jgi:hypothetical protein
MRLSEIAAVMKREGATVCGGQRVSTDSDGILQVRAVILNVYKIRAITQKISDTSN